MESTSQTIPTQNSNPSIHINCTCGYNNSLDSLKAEYVKNISSDVQNKANGGDDLILILDTISSTFDFDYEDSIMLFVHRVCKELLVPNVEYAYRMLREYVKYMALLVLKIQNKIPKTVCEQDLRFIPSAKIFALWRFHILYSSKYIEFCQKLNKGERLHLNINKFFNLDVLETEENLKGFRSSYENFLTVYKYYYGEIAHPTFWPDFYTNTVEYVFRFCLFPDTYKFLNSKHDFEENTLIPDLLAKSKLMELNDFRKDVIDILNKYRETTGMTIESMKNYWKTKVLEDSKYDQETLANKKIDEFFNGHISAISEIKSDPELWKKYVYCRTFSFPENFYYILSHEMLLDCESIDKLVTEYRRFLFLRCYRPKMVFTPSEEVDVVWHLHLNFTFIYLKTTKQLLGYEYLHNPTKGGKKELDKHTSLYDATLYIYKKLFGNAGNLNWPGGKERFTTNPYWFVLTEKYLEGRLERMHRKKEKEEEKGFVKNFLELDWKIKVLMILFLAICTIAGGYFGRMLSIYGQGKTGFDLKNFENRGGD